MRFEWTDTTRVDADSPNGHRELVVWVWYPAQSANEHVASTWLPGKWGELYWADLVRGHAGAIADTVAHPLSSIRTHARDDAGVARGPQPFPVLVFAPGSGAIPLEYAGVIENVASHGFVVAAIASPRVAGFTVFADGRVVMARDLTGRSSPPSQRPRSADEVIRNFRQAAQLLSNDMSFTLTQLAALSADKRSMFADRIDAAHAGAIGHSLGGAAVLYLAHDDARVGAVFDIDGSPVWDASNGGVGKPVLILSSASVTVGYLDVLSEAKPGVHLRLTGTGHTFSTDIRSMPFLRQLADSSSIAPNRALAVTATYIEAFFGQYLRHVPSDLLAGPSRQFPEVEFERR
jgi:dienelactone hydrolase